MELGFKLEQLGSRLKEEERAKSAFKAEASVLKQSGREERSSPSPLRN